VAECLLRGLIDDTQVAAAAAKQLLVSVHGNFHSFTWSASDVLKEEHCGHHSLIRLQQRLRAIEALEARAYPDSIATMVKNSAEPS